jgi:deoxyribonuclease-4
MQAVYRAGPGVYNHEAVPRATPPQPPASGRPPRRPSAGGPAARTASRRPLLGAHVSVAGGLANAFARAAELGCDAIQIFVKNANQWRGRPLLASEVAEFRAARAASAVGPVVAHASYLINLAAADPVVAARSREALADELERCGRLGVDGLVLHPGAHLGAGEEAGADRAAAALAEVLAAVPAGGCRVLLENTAGQGSCLGWRLEHLARIRAGVGGRRRRARVGICIDSCHAFAAGYPVHEPSGWDDLLAELDRLGLADELACLHLNDSARPFGSRRDRHAHVGEGAIGRPAFARLLAHAALGALPMILETEHGPDMSGLRADLEVLRGLRDLRDLRGLRELRSPRELPGEGAPRVRTRGGSPAGSATGRTRRRPPSASG